MGIVCPMGHDVSTVWDGMLNGGTGVDCTTIFDASTFPTNFCAEVKDFDVTKYTKNPDLHKDASRGSSFAVGALAQACKEAGIEIETDEPSDGIDRTRLGIYLGAGEGSVDNENFFDAMAKAWQDENRQSRR